MQCFLRIEIQQQIKTQLFHGKKPQTLQMATIFPCELGQEQPYALPHPLTLLLWACCSRLLVISILSSAKHGFEI